MLEIVYWPDGAQVAYELDSGANTVTTWDEAGNQTSQRPLNAAEQARAAAADFAVLESENLSGLEAKAQAALANNIAALALPDPTPGNQTYLALVSPTTAQAVTQVKALTKQNNALIAQVAALTRQVNGLIRLAQGLLDSTDGT